MKKFFVFLLLFALTGCMLLPEPVPNAPRYYKADFDEVWNAAVDTLEDLGFVILQMRREDGYISTDRRERDSWRDKVSLRFLTEGDSVRVTVTSSRELLSQDPDRPGTLEWAAVPSHGYLEKRIKDRIASKLEKRRY